MKKYEWYDDCNLGKEIVRVRYEQYYYIYGSPILCLLHPFTYIDMSGRGHRRLRLCSCKNYEKKKYAVMKVCVTTPASTTSSKASGGVPTTCSIPECITDQSRNAEIKAEEDRRVFLSKLAFTIPGLKVFLSEQLCQDPLECFGCQSQRGGSSENPNTVEFCKKYSNSPSDWFSVWRCTTGKL